MKMGTEDSLGTIPACSFVGFSEGSKVVFFSMPLIGTEDRGCGIAFLSVFSSSRPASDCFGA